MLNRLNVGSDSDDPRVPARLYEGDTILLTVDGKMGETVRQVAEITPMMSATTTASVSDDSDRTGDDQLPVADLTRKEVLGHYVKLDHPLGDDFPTGTGVTIYKVTNPNATAAKCPTCALAPEITPAV